MLVSEDQTGRLGFDGAGLLVDVQVGYGLRRRLAAELSVLGGMFPATHGSAGGLLAPMGGLHIASSDQSVKVYAFGEVGPAFTGHFVRPQIRLATGVQFRAGRRFAVGPEIGYFQVFYPNGQLDSTDARALYLTIALSFAPSGSKPKPAESPRTVAFEPRPVEVEKVRVEERERVVHEPAPPQELSAELEQLLERAVPRSRVELLAPVLFRFDSDDLEPVGVAMLHEVVRALRARPEIQLVEIQGYADQRGGSEYNARLSQRRALCVQQWLVAHGVAPERLRVSGYGADDPVEPGGAERAHAQNRRVVFRVLREGKR